MSGARAERGGARGRRERTGALALATALGLTVLAAQPGVAPAQAAKRPNVVVVMSDDQELRSMKVMTQTRRLLGRKGTTFRNFFATTPRCCPSRATFLTGRYAHNHGVRGGSFTVQRFDQFDDSRTLPRALDRAGYRTGHIGKYLNGYGDPGTNVRYIPPGWDDWRAPVRKTHHSQFDYVLNENGRLRSYGHRDEDYQTDVYARKSASFIGRASRRARPFFLTVAPSAPHVEPGEGLRRRPRPAPRHSGRFESRRLPKPPSFNEPDVSDKPPSMRREPLSPRAMRTLTERYQDRLASLLAVDDAVGAIVRKLRKTGELDNTVVMYTSDNGYLLGEHRRVKKTLLYEESAKVPLIVRGPGLPSGARRKQVTGNIDLAPTILDLANVEPRWTMDGISLRPLARRPDAQRKRSIVLENHLSSALRTPRYMYAEHPKGERELYAMKRNDPHGFPADRFQEHSRHVGSPRERRPSAALQAVLARRLAQLRSCSGEGCR